MGLGANTHANRVAAALRGSGPARSAVLASWQRSARLHRLDPAERRTPLRLSDREVAERRERLAPLLRAAAPGMDRLAQAVGAAGCCLLLADPDGVPVERRGGACDDETFEAWGLWTGTVWSEAAEGTNGIGTCLAEARALTIHRDQHFHSRNTGLSCTTAPVFDHEGRLAAALDVSSARRDLTPDVTALIALALADAVRRIEAEHFRLRFPHARILLAPNADAPNALLAVDRDDLVVGATRAARLALRLSDADLAQPSPAAVFFGPTPDTLGALHHSAIARALALARGNVSAAARALGVSRATLHRHLARERRH